MTLSANNPVTLDLTQWRSMFPQYANTTVYPDATLNLLWDEVIAFCDPSQFGSVIGTSRTFAMYLLLAHFLYLFMRAQNAGTMAGGAAGAKPSAMVESSTVGQVSVSYQAPPIRNAWQGWLQASPYGQQLLALLQVQVAGGFYVGGAPENLAFRNILGP